MIHHVICRNIFSRNARNAVVVFQVGSSHTHLGQHRVFSRPNTQLKRFPLIARQRDYMCWVDGPFGNNAVLPKHFLEGRSEPHLNFAARRQRATKFARAPVQGVGRIGPGVHRTRWRFAYDKLRVNPAMGRSRILAQMDNLAAMA